jgi:terminase large subunit-like protein
MVAVHQLSDGELAIFKKVEETGDPNWFTSFYLRGDNSGTWWKPGATSDRWKNGYNALHNDWTKKGKPPKFEFAKNKYTVIPQGDDEYPSFHHHHGFLFQPWQKEVYLAKQRIRVIFGGYGSGKTIGGIVGMLLRAATLPGYRGLVLAPNSNMTTEVFEQAVQTVYGTKFDERFVIKATEKPFPRIKIGNSLVGERNMIQFFPIGDSIGAKKILSLTIDEAFIDQAEQLHEISDIIRNVGSRMRGMYRGRERLGKMTFSANADFNDNLWDLFDEQDKDPDRVVGFQPKTWDNPFITDEQIVEIKKDVGGDKESVRVHMEGGRPVAGGEHFSAATLMKCKSSNLDDLMKRAIDSDLEGHVYETRDKIGVVHWALPPRPDRKYLVVADPGYDNPPNRNSPVIMVFDYTDFPKMPAFLWAFHWVDGNSSPEPWLQKFTECLHTYNAYMSNAFDSTGPQAGYERLVPHLNDIHASGVSMGGNNKFIFLNTTKRLAARGLFNFPSISGIFQQLSRYKLPDTKLKQDIVSTLLVASAWLESVFYSAMNEDYDERENHDYEDRYLRDRSGRTADRHIRYISRGR